MRHEGKVRPIDDAHRGGHNDATCASERIALCNAAQPVVDACALVDAAEALGVADELKEQHLQSGGDDMPNTFCTVPCAQEDNMVNIAAIFDPDSSAR